MEKHIYREHPCGSLSIFSSLCILQNKVLDFCEQTLTDVRVSAFGSSQTDDKHNSCFALWDFFCDVDFLIGLHAEPFYLYFLSLRWYLATPKASLLPT